MKYFDEEKYLKRHPDVTEAVQIGQIKTGLEHYIKYGHKEHREYFKTPNQDLSVFNIEHQLINTQEELREIRNSLNLDYASKRIKKKNLVIFYTPRHFDGNLKYSFLQFHENNKANRKIEYFFLTLHEDLHEELKTHGLPTLHWNNKNSLTLMKLLEAKVVVDDGFLMNGEPNPRALTACLSGARRINLWHGTPLQKIMLQSLSEIPQAIDEHFISLIQNAISNDVILGTHQNDFQLFRDAAQIDNFYVTGYARNDVFYRDIMPLDLIGVDQESYEKAKKSSKKIAIYTPTWRQFDHKWLTKIDLTLLKNKLSQIGYELWIHPHPFEAKILESHLKELEIQTIKPHTDIYPILKEVEIMITDYSSVFIDFLHARRPIFIFRPDHLEYLSAERKLDEERCSKFIHTTSSNINELCESIEKHSHSIRQKCISSINTAHEYQDHLSSSRTASIIEQIVRQ